MRAAPAWQHVMLHGLPARACVERAEGRDYARVIERPGVEAGHIVAAVAVAERRIREGA